MKAFSEVILKTSLNDLKTFWASFGKFEQKSFALPKICLLLHSVGLR